MAGKPFPKLSDLKPSEAKKQTLYTIRKNSMREHTLLIIELEGDKVVSTKEVHTDIPAIVLAQLIRIMLDS